MREYVCTEEQFLKDVSKLEMEIIRDEGTHRHVRFYAPKTYQYHFNLIMWPGHLCISGDMGTYVFSRIMDMFEFFRTKPKHLADSTIYINPGYWAEKVLAEDKNGKIFEYSREKAKIHIRDAVREETGSKEKRREMFERCMENVDESEEECMKGLLEYWPDAWEWNLKDFTYSYIWACLAISWGIRQYDNSKPSAFLDQGPKG